MTVPSTDKTLPALIAEVSAQMARLEKKGTAPAAMGAFKFVRETDVIETLKPELDSRGIVLRPDVELLRLDTFERQGKDMPNTVATVSLALWAIRGAEEYLISRTVGQGADTQDKAVGKAVTSAKKQAFLIAFAIPTGDDPDAHALPERSARTQQSGAGRQSKPESGPVPAPAGPSLDQIKARLLTVASEHHLGAAALDLLIEDYVPKGSTPEKVREGLILLGTAIGRGKHDGGVAPGASGAPTDGLPPMAEAMTDEEAIAAGAALVGK
jgi:hypothetical protein